MRKERIDRRWKGESGRAGEKEQGERTKKAYDELCQLQIARVQNLQKIPIRLRGGSIKTSERVSVQ